MMGALELEHLTVHTIIPRHQSSMSHFLSIESILVHKEIGEQIPFSEAGEGKMCHTSRVLSSGSTVVSRWIHS